MRLLLLSIVFLSLKCTAPVKPTEPTKAANFPNPVVFTTNSYHLSILKERLTLNFKEVRLQDILDTISEKTGCFFSGSIDLRDSAGRFTINCEQLSLQKCLNVIASQNGTIKFLLTVNQIDSVPLILDVVAWNNNRYMDGYIAFPIND